jgi:hypothetical protein
MREIRMAKIEADDKKKQNIQIIQYKKDNI